MNFFQKMLNRLSPAPKTVTEEIVLSFAIPELPQCHYCKESGGMRKVVRGYPNKMSEQEQKEFLKYYTRGGCWIEEHQAEFHCVSCSKDYFSVTLVA